MTHDEFATKALTILPKIEEPEEVGKIIDELTAAYRERYETADTLEREVERLKAINERLQRVNGEMLMRTGVQGDPDELKGAEDEKGIDFTDLFTEDGELK